MIFTETNLLGSFIVEPEKISDERGFFARTFDKKIFGEKNICSNFVQSNISFNKKKGTIRGLHYQKNPFEEEKLVHCTHGSVFEVIVDLRPNSTTFKKWISIILDAENNKMLYVPKGCALGFQTLDDNVALNYHMSEYYQSSSSGGILWNDSDLNIKWPLVPTVISKKDLGLPTLKSII